MEFLSSIPWYAYPIFIVALFYWGRHYYKGIRKFIKGEESESIEVVFREDPESHLNERQLFSLALCAANTEYMEDYQNVLGTHEEILELNRNHILVWGIDSKEGYWETANYFMEGGRRVYFDFIMQIMETQPEDQWDTLVEEKYGDNRHVQTMLKDLKSGVTKDRLKEKGIIIFDSEIELGIAAFDIAFLVEHAKFAYSSQYITEQEAWRVINFATELAREQFSSWEDFGKSQAIGISIVTTDPYAEDMLNLIKQVIEDPESPWNTINWAN